MLKAFAGKTKTANENVWVDAKATSSAGSSPPTASTGCMRMAMTMDLSDYGAHVTIAAPPSSQVFDTTQLAQQGHQQAPLP